MHHLLRAPLLRQLRERALHAIEIGESVLELGGRHPEQALGGEGIEIPASGQQVVEEKPLGVFADEMAVFSPGLLRHLHGDAGIENAGGAGLDVIGVEIPSGR